MAIEPRARRESGLGCDVSTHERSKLGPSFRTDFHTIRGDLCCSTSLASRFPSRVGFEDEDSPSRERVREAMHRQSPACDPPVNTDSFRPLPVSSQTDSVSRASHRQSGSNSRAFRIGTGKGAWEMPTSHSNSFGNLDTLVAARQESSLGREPFLAEAARLRKPYKSGADVQLQKETENPRIAAELIETR
jgi:hypothetical protein